MVVSWEECKDEREQLTNIGARALNQIIDLTDWTMAKSAQEGGPNRIAPVKRRILSKSSETWRAAPQVVVFLRLHIVRQVLRNESAHKNSTRDDHAKTSNGTEKRGTTTCILRRLTLPVTKDGFGALNTREEERKIYRFRRIDAM